MAVYTTGPTTYDLLPVPDQLALLQYMGEGDVPDPAERCERFMFRRHVVPVELAKRAVFEADPTLAADHGTFDAYHRWYVGRGDMPDHGQSRWPSILSGTVDRAAPGCEWLDDGWHRFHNYLAAGDRHVVVLELLPNA